MKQLILAVMITFCLVAPAHAQDGDQLKCTDQDTAITLQTVIDELTAAQDRDAAAQYEAASQARKSLAALDSLCLGLFLEGEIDTVSEPMFIPSGIYRVVLTTAKGSIMRVEALVLDGVCQESYGTGEDFRLFGIDTDQDASNGIQAVLQSDGCTLVWNTWWVDTQYTITFEKLN